MGDPDVKLPSYAAAMSYPQTPPYPANHPYGAAPYSPQTPYQTGPPHAGASFPPQAPYQPHQPYGAAYDVPGNNQSDEFPASAEAAFVSSSFSEKSVRHAFIRKVYLILTAQLLVTAAFVCVFTLVKPVSLWVRKNSWVYYASYGVFLVTYIALACCQNVRRRFPGNFIAMAIFTLAFSYVTGTIASFYQTESVLIAVAITAAVCLAVSIFAIQTRIDFTKCAGLLLVLSLVLFLTGIACMIVFLVSGPNRVLQAVYGGLAALVFGLYLIFDTQMVIGGRKHELSAEEYIYGALQLYMDVVNLFLIFLALFGKRN